MGRCSGKPQFLLCLKLDKTSCSLHPPWKLQRKIFHQEHALGFERSQHYLIRRCLLSGYWCLGSILQDWSFPSTSSSSRIIFWAECLAIVVAIQRGIDKGLKKTFIYQDYNLCFSLFSSHSSNRVLCPLFSMHNQRYCQKTAVTWKFLIFLAHPTIQPTPCLVPIL